MIDPNNPQVTTALSTIPNEPVSSSTEEKPKKRRRTAILARIRLIVYIVVDYLTDLFNRNSRDYREVSIQLAEMKSRDKILQQEQLRSETAGLAVSNSLSHLFSPSLVFIQLEFSSEHRSSGWW